MPDTRIPKYLLNWTPAYGRRSRGRPRKNWMKCLLEDAAAFTGNTDINLEEVNEMASDRLNTGGRCYVTNGSSLVQATRMIEET